MAVAEECKAPKETTNLGGECSECKTQDLEVLPALLYKMDEMKKDRRPFWSSPERCHSYIPEIEPFQFRPAQSFAKLYRVKDKARRGWVAIAVEA